jgi:hypothetical protein
MRKEVNDRMHSIELEKRLRLPDPAKTIEGVWKLLKRNRQQLNATARNSAGVLVTGEALAARKSARVEAERQKARGTQYGLRTIFR